MKLDNYQELEIIFLVHYHIEHYNGCFFEFEAQFNYSVSLGLHNPQVTYKMPSLPESYYSPELHVREVNDEGIPKEIIQSLRAPQMGCGIGYYYNMFGEEEFKETFNAIFDDEMNIGPFLIKLLNGYYKLTNTHELGPCKIYADRIRIRRVDNMGDHIRAMADEYENELQHFAIDELRACRDFWSLKKSVHDFNHLDEWMDFIIWALYQILVDKRRGLI